MKSITVVLLAFVLASAKAINMCVDHGCFDYDGSQPCQCNKFCTGYENCCDDYVSSGCATCQGMGGCVDYDNRHYCQCNVDCSQYGNCCSDYESFCAGGGGGGDNCIGRCFTSADHTKTCQCNTLCTTYNDCCTDYSTTCSGSPTTTTTTTSATTTTTTAAAPSNDNCVGRCEHSFDGSKSCQCNSACHTYRDCCSDYSSTCSGSSGGGLDFDAFGTAMWANDVNRIDSSHYTVDIQNAYLSSSSNNVDQAAGPLFTNFEEDIIFNTGTFVEYLQLCDNYEPNQGITEDRDSVPTEKSEQDAYLDAVMATPLMVKAVEMLTEAGLVTDAADFRAKMVTAFFDLYQRTASDDSSGFEHCFCGEWKSSTQVNGFHNWITFYQLEKQGALNYYGHFGMSDPEHLGVQFYWEGRKKPLTSIVLGVSTEFELAIYMACFLENPGSVTSFTITDGANSYPIKVQTYMKDTVHVGSAYFIS